MHESEAENKTCPFHYTAHYAALQAAMLKPHPQIDPKDIDAPQEIIDHDMNYVPNLRILYCDGPDCAMWEPEYKVENREVDRDAPAPGPEWFKKQRIVGQPKDLYYRYVPTEYGDCGLKSKENGCFYPG